MIRKTSSGKYKVLSHQTGKSFGTYTSKAKAITRLRQMKGHAKKGR